METKLQIRIGRGEMIRPTKNNKSFDTFSRAFAYYVRNIKMGRQIRPYIVWLRTRSGQPYFYCEIVYDYKREQELMAQCYFTAETTGGGKI